VAIFSRPKYPACTTSQPEVMQDILRIRRLEKSIYKPTDIWTGEDDLLFCKFSSSKRDRAYSIVARDTGCRPHEIVNMKNKDGHSANG
jgi:hypothetical protein